MGVSLPNIDLQNVVETLTGHASAGGLVGGIAATALGAIATSALSAAATSPGVLKALNPLGLQGPITVAASPAPAPAAAAPTGPTIALAAFNGLDAETKKSVLAAGYHIV